VTGQSAAHGAVRRFGGDARATLGAVGLGTRIAAAGYDRDDAGAILMVHAPHGSSRTWTGTQGGEGFELHILALASSIPLIFRGAGAYSFDRILASRARFFVSGWFHDTARIAEARDERRVG